MALEAKYEGLIDGTMNAKATELEGSSTFEPGRLVGLGDVGEVTVDLTSTTPYGMLMDYKDDIIASGKVSIYLNGVYYTDQHTGSPSKGDALTHNNDGVIITATNGDIAVGICIEAEGDDGMILMKLDINGATVTV